MLQYLQATFNLRVYLCEGNWSACLPVHQSAQSSLAFDDAVWDTHLTTESWQENDELKGQKQLIFRRDKVMEETFWSSFVVLAQG